MTTKYAILTSLNEATSVCRAIANRRGYPNAETKTNVFSAPLASDDGRWAVNVYAGDEGSLTTAQAATLVSSLPAGHTWTVTTESTSRQPQALSFFDRSVLAGFTKGFTISAETGAAYGTGDYTEFTTDRANRLAIAKASGFDHIRLFWLIEDVITAPNNAALANHWTDIASFITACFAAGLGVAMVPASGYYRAGLYYGDQTNFYSRATIYAAMTNITAAVAALSGYTPQKFMPIVTNDSWAIVPRSPSGNQVGYWPQRADMIDSGYAGWPTPPMNAYNAPAASWAPINAYLPALCDAARGGRTDIAVCFQLIAPNIDYASCQLTTAPTGRNWVVAGFNCYYPIYWISQGGVTYSDTNYYAAVAAGTNDLQWDVFNIPWPLRHSQKGAWFDSFTSGGLVAPGTVQKVSRDYIRGLIVDQQNDFGQCDYSLPGIQQFMEIYGPMRYLREAGIPGYCTEWGDYEWTFPIRGDGYPQETSQDYKNAWRRDWVEFFRRNGIGWAYYPEQHLRQRPVGVLEARPAYPWRPEIIASLSG